MSFTEEHLLTLLRLLAKINRDCSEHFMEILFLECAAIIYFILIDLGESSLFPPPVNERQQVSRCAKGG